MVKRQTYTSSKPNTKGFQVRVHPCSPTKVDLGLRGDLKELDIEAAIMIRGWLGKAIKVAENNEADNGT